MKEAVTPPEVIQALTSAAEDEVLVGGQALAAWVVRYGIRLPARVASISNDVDFLARSAAATGRVEHFAAVLGGESHFPNERALTALVGQAYRRLSDDEFLNVDVLFKLIGLSAKEVRERAIQLTSTAGSFWVMHPLHVLKSRLVNLYKLPEKQNEKGEMQLRLAIEVVRAFMGEKASEGTAADLASGRSPVQRYVNSVVMMARSDAGKKVAKRAGIHVADAVDPSLFPAGPFWERRWPRIRPMMSEGWASQFAEPSEESAADAHRPRGSRA